MTEFEFINWIRARTPDAEGVALGPGDDCAVLDLAGAACIVTTDRLIGGVHYDPDTTPPEMVGRKALARSISDIAAMAAIPVAAVTCVIFPPGYDAAMARRLYAGMEMLAGEYDVALVGGDVATGAAQVILSVTVIGRPGTTTPLLRSGAKPGDRILVTGELGGSLAGHHLDFSPRVREALAVAASGDIHAMIDISDGLTADLNHILEESKCGAVLQADAIPVSEAARAMASDSGRDPLEHALGDGEDYELLFTTPPAEAARAIEAVSRMVRVSDIGTIVAKSGMWLEDARGQRPIEHKGWVHRLGTRGS